MKRRRVRLVTGIGMILLGICLVWIASVRHVDLVINGKSTLISTRAFRVADLLRQAGIDYSSADRIRPGLNSPVKNGGRIFLDRAADISLTAGNLPEPVSFTSYQRFGGNILLDAGLRLFPGDRLFWNGVEIRPDFDLSGASDLDLRLENADTFTLVTQDDPDGSTAFGSGNTVSEVLMSAGVNLNKSTMVFPDGETPFTSGMTIEVLPIRELTVSREGRLFTLASAGATVGEALTRAGIPLMGSDISIPAANEALPDDGRILIVPVTDSFAMNAETIRKQTEWTANEELELDETRLIAEGTDGLKGTFTRTRTENGDVVLNETSQEEVLLRPVDEKREFGTKVVIRTLDTPEGPIEYYRSVKVYATSYSPCRSGTSACITGTASGRKVEKGVAAVTSDWYKRFGGQSVYIPDYGKAVIADVGGGIAGRNWIDLAYGDDDFTAWHQDTTLYFLTPVPADMVWVLQ